MEDLLKLLKILYDNSQGVTIDYLLHIHNISLKTIKIAKSRGLIIFYDEVMKQSRDSDHHTYYCRITPLGSDYIITGGAEGAMSRDKQNRKLLLWTLAISIASVVVSIILHLIR